MGKPLISDAQMLAMHRTIRQLAALPRRGHAQAAEAWPPAVLAAALLQLRTDDVLVCEGEQPLAAKVLELARADAFSPDVLPLTVTSQERAGIGALAAGYALAQSRFSHPGDAAPITLALLQPGTPLQEAMRLAGEHRLPLLSILRDEPNRPRAPMSPPENVEVMLVDAEDAVAVCRVMQESLIRTRNRWGSVVLRAVTLPGSVAPLPALEEHLRRRSLLQ